MNPVDLELVAAVERSPQAAGSHDRAGWVGLFTEDGRIEDPVGSRPHVGRAQIERFYDTFIEPRDITFHRDVDIAAEASVVRDLSVEVAMGPRVTLMIPMILRYDLRSGENGWQIARLRAYWELSTLMGQFLRRGAASVPVSGQLSARLLRNQGVRGTAGFLRGLRGVGSRGKRTVAQRLAARGERVDKIIAAGQTVAAAVTTRAGRGVVFTDFGSSPDGRGNEVRFCASGPPRV